MVYECLYRLTNEGEICFGHFDDETGTILEIPRNILSVENKVLFRTLIPENGTGDLSNLATAELHMMACRNIRIAVHYHGECIPMFDEVGTIIALTSEGVIYHHNMHRLNIDSGLKEVGYRPTRVRQLIGDSYPYRLIYSQTEKCFITNDGFLYPTFDVESLSKLNIQCFGYRELIINKDKYYAVVYKNGEPIFLRKVSNTLQFIGG